MSENREITALVTEAARCRLSALRAMEDPARGDRLIEKLWKRPEKPVVERHRQRVLSKLRQSVTFALDTKSQQVIDGSWTSFPFSVVFKSDIPAPWGWIQLCERIAHPSWPELPYKVGALSWGVDLAPAVDGMPELAVIDVIAWSYTDELSDCGVLDREEARCAPRMVPVSVSMWELDRPLNDQLLVKQLPQGRHVAEADEPVIRFLATYWAILRQGLLAVEEKEPAGSVVKGYRRAARRAADLSPNVRAVRMRGAQRRTVRSDRAEPLEREFSWMVRPFWRNQWYPASGEHKPILIAAHTRGPADKPIRHGDRVFLPPKDLRPLTKGDL